MRLPLLLFPLLLLVLSAGERDVPRPPEPAKELFKCCEKVEVWVQDRGCANASEWLPQEVDLPWVRDMEDDAFDRVQVGNPRCANTQLWTLLHYQGSHDELELRPGGWLRHYTRSHAPPWEGTRTQSQSQSQSQASNQRPRIDHILDAIGDVDDEEDELEKERGVRFHYDYAPGTFCIDVFVGEKFDKRAQYAAVCAPQIQIPVNRTDFVMRRIVNPVCHGIAIACYLLVAVLYFVLPQLRDLVGNMLTTLATCLIASQASDLVRIFTQFSSHVSFLVADVVMYVSLLASFFWLNSLGYYIWKTFKSRNVYIRITDARKYCYYSAYAWGATLSMASIALFAHFLLDTSNPTVPSPSSSHDSIGRLGIAVFFTPIAFTILVNIFFYLTTGQAISRVSTRGSIHHKMKYCFDMFVKLFLVMAVAWLFLVLSWLPYDVLAYCNIVVNLLQAMFFLYITVLGQKRVTVLVRQAFCHTSEVQDAAEWGEEMSPMSSAYY